MHFRQFYVGCLAHASYLIGDEGEAVVIDPSRDVQMYLDGAAGHGFRITHVLETHLHADFVSGHRDLQVKTGATIGIGPIKGNAVESGAKTLGLIVFCKKVKTSVGSFGASLTGKLTSRFLTLSLKWENSCGVGEVTWQVFATEKLQQVA